MSKTTNKFSPEVRERAVRLVLDNLGQHGSRWQAVLSISSKIGCAPQTLNDWVKKAEVDSGKRPGVSSEMAERMPHSARRHHALGSATASASIAQCPDPSRSPAASDRSSVPAAPLHAETPASVCSRFP